MTPAASDATLPLPAICATALRSRWDDQQRHREHAGRAWQDNGLVFTTRLGTPVEPRPSTCTPGSPRRSSGTARSP
ncbi:hypothetical protein MCAG_03508 [Micromonospora sp. ATCC 39149]|nr:hypothetical protein MCAG_03508 [Micromonospora sp. ATCC 39149]